ncbi:hypothetical protein lbkm_4215 [Lachnospiraceae bacterium KM106-2]|nr:hypothetical protein lbkm_4215 [Lachnospiraceae bacterium KM106-2]
MNENRTIQYVELGFEEALKKDSVKELKELAVMIGLTGYSKLKKDDLIKAIEGHVLDRERAKEKLFLAKEKEIKIFSHICENQDGFTNVETLADLVYILSNGYGLLNKDGVLIIPPQVKNIFREVVTEEFMKERERFHLINDYTAALIKLYGVVTINQIVDIFNAQNEEAVTKEEVKEVYKRGEERGHYYTLKRTTFIHETVTMDENGYDKLVAAQEGKPAFVPEKTELVKYADDNYVRQSNEYLVLRAQIIKYITQNEVVADNLCDEIEIACSLSEELPNIIGLFEHNGLGFSDVRQAEMVVPYIIDLFNHTRMWVHKGHTPSELKALKVKDNGFMDIGVGKPGVPQRLSQKIGRNDPCPCGSGKKYKFCCGR